MTVPVLLIILRKYVMIYKPLWIQSCLYKALYFVVILSIYTWKITGSFCMRRMIHSICREHHSQAHTFGVFFHSSLNTRGLSLTI